MSESIRILIIEDMPADAELAQWEIEQALEPCSFQRVETRAEFLAALETFQPDLIISDYRLPNFDGLTALKLALEHVPLTPVIILTGAINEDTAVECMKAGAADYVIKEHIRRLGQAVMHALEEKKVRQQRWQAEEALRESEERYRILVQTLPDAVTITDLAGNITYASPLTVHFYGHETEAEVLGHNILEWVHISQHQQAIDAMQIVLAGSFIRNQEYLLLKKDGFSFLGEVSASCLKNAHGQTIGLIIIVRDISERKRAEEAVKHLNHQMELILNSAGEGIYGADAAGKIIFCNPAMAHMLGWEVTELLGQSAHDLCHHSRPDGQPYPREECPIYRVLRNGLTHHADDEFFWRKDGTTFPVEYTSTPIREGEQVVGTVVVFKDITERKQAEEARIKLEEQLRQAQKMESIGRLAGGIAHDFNNLLTVIQGHSMLVRDKIPGDDPLQEQLGMIQHASERAAALTRQLLAFSRKQMLTPTRLDLNQLVHNLRHMLERLIGEDISLSTVLQPELWPITADPGQLEQVIVNLAVNARDAMPTGGRLTIETANIYLDGNHTTARLDIPPGPYVLLAITDTGYGMDEQIQAHLFEPFFTTKEVGKGTGLGLAMVYGIIKQSGGDITVYSQPEQGTTFTIYIPAHPASVPRPVAPSAQPISQGGSEVILLVEDEEMVRDLMCDTLQNKGYTVLEASQGQTALSLAKLYEGQIDLLLTDVVMPQMSGRELAERLKALQPGLKILFMSGYTDDTVVRHGLLAAEVDFLPKPFLPSTLVLKVREILDK